ncbi:hypothetical protein [Trueperella pyogenes]
MTTHPNSNGRPKYFTRRNPARPTLGPIVAKVSEAVRGYPLMPWQKYAVNVAWELDPAHPGELFYSEGDISVPRQSGKSNLIETMHIAGAMLFRNWTSSMTAQTGKAAGTRWADLVASLNLGQGTRAADWKVQRGKGAENLIFLPQNGAINPFPPVEDALHGDHRNFVTIDEEWAFTLAEGTALETAAKPTMLTVPFSQLLRVSTMGTANSEYMNRNVEAGRLATKDPAARRFYFEWSADEAAADADPYSDQTLAFHPAIGHTQSARRIRDLGKDIPLGEWRRSFLNLPTQSSETIIDLAMWDSLRWNYQPTAAQRYRPGRPEDIVICWDVAADGSRAAIYAAWLQESTNDPAVSMVAAAPGYQWLAPKLAELDRLGYRAIIADDAGPNRTVYQQLETERIRTELISFSTYATACQTFLDRVKTGRIEHDGQPLISDQIGAAVLRDSGKARIIDPRKSAGPVDALRALAIAQDAAITRLNSDVFQLY